MDDLEARVADWLAAFHSAGGPEVIIEVDDSAEKGTKKSNGRKAKPDNVRAHLMREYQKVLGILIEHYFEKWGAEQGAVDVSED